MLMSAESKECVTSSIHCNEKRQSIWWLFQIQVLSISNFFDQCDNLINVIIISCDWKKVTTFVFRLEREQLISNYFSVELLQYLRYNHIIFGGCFKSRKKNTHMKNSTKLFQTTSETQTTVWKIENCSYLTKQTKVLW